MTKSADQAFLVRTLAELTIEDEPSFRHVGLYADLKEILRHDRYTFRVLPASVAGRWDRALLLNLTFWGVDGGGDVLTDEAIAADVVTHAAWHHLAARALLTPGVRPSAEALFLGEAIASAFDVYLVGRLLGHAPESSFLESQVPLMADTAEAAGLPEEGFTALLDQIAVDPERAFEDLRQLLFDASLGLLASRSAEEGLAALARLDGHRFAPLLHRFELSTWVLYARAYSDTSGPDPRARELDQALRQAPVALDWLTQRWVLGRSA
jgi:hypothetical protein